MITIKTQFFFDDESTIEIDNATSLLQYPSSMYIFEKSTRMICRNVFGMSSFFRLSAFYRHSLLRDDINLSHSLLNILKKKNYHPSVRSSLLLDMKEICEEKILYCYQCQAYVWIDEFFYICGINATRLNFHMMTSFIIIIVSFISIWKMSGYNHDF